MKQNKMKLSSCNSNLHLYPHFLIILLSSLFVLNTAATNLISDDEFFHNVNPPEKSAPITPLFVFGDSLYDPGNNNYINTTNNSKANFLPYGQSYFQFATGRFSDGRTVPDFIAKYANLPLIPPYFQSSYRQFSYGVNFASAGAGSLPESSHGNVDLKQQFDYFKDVERQLRKYISENETSDLLSRAVYMFSIGANDMGQKSPYFTHFTTEEFLDIVVSNLTDVLKGIYNSGGRKFGLFKLLNLGCFPAARGGKEDGEICAEDLLGTINLYNLKVSEELKNLEKQFHGFNYSLFDFFSAFNEWIQHPSKYGFEEVKSACCGSGKYRGTFTCGGKRENPEYELCENPRNNLFFDSFHPSERASELIAGLMWDGPSSIIGPYTLKQFFEPHHEFHPIISQSPKSPIATTNKEDQSLLSSKCPIKLLERDINTMQFCFEEEQCKKFRTLR